LPQAEGCSNVIECFRKWNPLTGFHLRNSLGDCIAILLAAKSIHRLPVHFTLDNEINSQRIGIDDFEFVIPGRVQSGGKFFRQFRGHTAIIRQSGAGEKERTGEK
jgi:hypothetical protein